MLRTGQTFERRFFLCSSRFWAFKELEVSEVGLERLSRLAPRGSNPRCPTSSVSVGGKRHHLRAIGPNQVSDEDGSHRAAVPVVLTDHVRRKDPESRS